MAYLTTFLCFVLGKPQKRSCRIGWSPGKDLKLVPPKCKMWLLRTLGYRDTSFHVLIYLLFEIKLCIKLVS